MKRGPSGTSEISTTAGESARAFLPNPLPPDPALDWGSLQRLHDEALHAIGALSSVSTVLPDPDFFIFSYIRKEAVISSQIEGTQSTLSDLLLFELDSIPGVPINDVQEVSRYVHALYHASELLRRGLPPSLRFIREMHRVLLDQGRGESRDPGEFRRTQNWIGGTGPANASFVPPPHNRVMECMGALELFLHRDDVPVLVRAGLAHAQFETIHPFLDGNGRVGRLLVTVMLTHAGLLNEPLLYLSLHFKKNREEYYRLLNAVRFEGDWEAWMEFFLIGVRDTARSAVSTVQRLARAFQADESTVKSRRRGGAGLLAVYGVLKARPLLTAKEAARLTGLSFPTASRALENLAQLGIVREVTGKSRNRVFAYDKYISILTEE